MGVQNLQYYKRPANCRFTNAKTVTRGSRTRNSPAKPCQAKKKKVMIIQSGWFKSLLSLINLIKISSFDPLQIDHY